MALLGARDVILLKIQLYRVNSEIANIFFDTAVKYDTIKHFADFGCVL